MVSTIKYQFKYVSCLYYKLKESICMNLKFKQVDSFDLMKNEIYPGEELLVRKS